MTKSQIFSEAPALSDPVSPPDPPQAPEGSVAAALRELGGVGPSLAGGQRNGVLDPDKHAQFKLVPIDDVYPDPDQPRKKMKNIMDMRASLDESGMLQPITVRRGPKRQPYIIMYGERRWRGAKMAGWSHVPVIIRTDVRDTGVLVRQLMENSQREDLDPIEEARGIRAYMREQRIATMEEAAKRLGHHTNWASNRLALLDAEEEEQEAVSAGTLSMGKLAHEVRMRNGTARSAARKDGGGGGRGPAKHPVTTYTGGHWFDAGHPLTSKAKAKSARHGCKPLPGGIACGECWEGVIRADAARQLALSGGA